VFNGAALDLPGSLIARTRSKFKLDLRFHFSWLKMEDGDPLSLVKSSESVRVDRLVVVVDELLADHMSDDLPQLNRN
jgi:hypothetical protein